MRVCAGNSASFMCIQLTLQLRLTQTMWIYLNVSVMFFGDINRVKKAVMTVLLIPQHAWAHDDDKDDEVRILFWFLLTRLRELHMWSTVNDVAVGVIQRENHIVNMPVIHSFPSQRCWMRGLTQRIQSKVKVTVWILPVLMTIYSESPEGIISKKRDFY